MVSAHHGHLSSLLYLFGSEAGALEGMLVWVLAGLFQQLQSSVVVVMFLGGLCSGQCG